MNELILYWKTGLVIDSQLYTVKPYVVSVIESSQFTDICVGLIVCILGYKTILQNLNKPYVYNSRLL